MTDGVGRSGARADTATDAQGSPGNRTAWFVYILECRDGCLYTGITRDLDRRFRQHLTGRGARFTRAHPPLRVLGTTACTDQSAASRLEYQIKRLPRERKYALAAMWADAGRAQPDPTGDEAPSPPSADTPTKRPASVSM